MDAMDINWCLTCNRHIDSDPSVPYCSRVCYASDQPSSSSVYPCLRQAEYASAATSVCDSDDYDESEYEPSLPSTERSQWIGKGAAGIEAWARNVHPGPPCPLEHALSTSDLRPKLLLPHRRPIPPTLCMSKTDPAPPAPSKPILTPHRSLASQCTPGASTASYTTPASSLSLATPVSEHAFVLPSAAAHDGKPGLIGALTKQFRRAAIGVRRTSTVRASRIAEVGIRCAHAPGESCALAPHVNLAGAWALAWPMARDLVRSGPRAAPSSSQKSPECSLSAHYAGSRYGRRPA
ncbi:hypothetical protein IEO21_01116 [Rhodonia placenta]|uniref:Uncharacterized protein n=1 Tax=Rhodonia placenta TaxID=104341 RepID=A0A8H7PAA7_9APHY|nr:hypothetical protein IEO21_01116 [Postia placenta]